MNQKNRVIGLALAAGLFAGSAFAQDAAVAEAPAPENAFTDIAGRWYVSPLYSFTKADSARTMDDASGGLLAVGKQVNRYFNLELYAFQSNYGGKESGDSDGKLRAIGLAAYGFPFAQSSDGLGRWLGGAYALIGAGTGEGKDFPERYGLFDQNRDRYIVDAGVGYLMRLPFIRFASLRLDARYRIDLVTKPFASVDYDEENDSPNFEELVLSAGVLVPIGAKPQPPPPPAPPAVIAPVVPPDSDGDGVPDNLDQCPGTPAGTVVDDKGCPVPNCPKPQPGERISLNGCGVGDVIVLNGVNFEFDKARLTANAETILNQVADELTTHADITVELAGHTDSLGSDEYNQRLSERRANAVKKYLTSRGIAADRTTAVGQGESLPVDTNETEEGREHNRRVELKILTGGGANVTVAPPAGAADAAAAPAADATAAPVAPAAATPVASEPAPTDAAPPVP